MSGRLNLIGARGARQPVPHLCRAAAQCAREHGVKPAWLGHNPFADSMIVLDPPRHGRLRSLSVTTVPPDMTARMEEIRTSIREAEQYVKQVQADRRREPKDDLVTDLLRAQVDGESLTEAEVTSFLLLLLGGGLETTVHLLNHTARVLMEHPEVLARVRADLSLIPRLVEEVLRYEPPVRSVYRLVMEDVELSGVRIPKGSRVLLLIGSANRDEAHFPDAERFDIDRGEVNNLPFGHGIHFCLGAPLARLEARVALEELLPRIQGLSAAGPAQWRRAMSIRGLHTLPLIAHPA